MTTMNDTNALVLPIAPASILPMQLSAEQQNAIVHNAVTAQRQEAVCKAALHAIREQLTSQIDSLTAPASALTTSIDATEKKIATAISKFAQSHPLAKKYRSVIRALALAGHKSSSTTIHDAPELHPTTKRYTTDLTARLTIEGIGHYDNTLTSDLATIDLPTPIQSLLRERDSLISQRTALSAEDKSLRAKRDSLWQMEDTMKAQLALKSISTDPAQAEALSTTLSFLQSKLGLSPSSLSTIAGAKRVRSTSKRR